MAAPDSMAPPDTLCVERPFITCLFALRSHMSDDRDARFAVNFLAARSPSVTLRAHHEDSCKYLVESDISSERIHIRNDLFQSATTEPLAVSSTRRICRIKGSTRSKPYRQRTPVFANQSHSGQSSQPLPILEAVYEQPLSELSLTDHGDAENMRTTIVGKSTNSDNDSDGDGGWLPHEIFHADMPKSGHRA